MKKSTNILVYCSILSMGLFLFTASCKKDKVPDRDKFLGVFSVVETCVTGNYAYDLTIIESGTAENAVIVGNIYAYGEQLSATVDGDRITIPSQFAGGITYSGTGSLSGNTLTLSYNLSSGADSDNCSATCVRK